MASIAASPLGINMAPYSSTKGNKKFTKSMRLEVIPIGAQINSAEPETKQFQENTYLLIYRVLSRYIDS